MKNRNKGGNTMETGKERRGEAASRLGRPYFTITQALRGRKKGLSRHGRHNGMPVSSYMPLADKLVVGGIAAATIGSMIAWRLLT